MGLQMQDALAAIYGLMFLVALILTMASIVKDVSPKLTEEERLYLRSLISSQPFSLWRAWRFNGTISRAWDLHVQIFPKSRKRILIGCILVSIPVSIVAYELFMLAIGPR